ncbi:hypothetical protein vseg_013872 [Gypsophila vaccaria]
MEESEKMVALKKAYAEIILNTAKEAAARVMASERKAHEYRHDLASTKEEALRLLLRLKQTMDAKIIEVELKSQDQQRKIEVLEAQLQEAEDIVSNLRDELNDAHVKLYRLANNRLRNGSITVDKDDSETGKSQPENRSTEAGLASQAARINNGVHGHSSANNSLDGFGCSGELEIPSIISRRKESERHLSRCTQKIHKCNGNLSKDHSILAGESDDLKDVKELREDNEGQISCVGSKKTPIADDSNFIEEEKLVDVKKVEDEEPVNIMQVLKSLIKRRKYKRNSASPSKHVSDVAKETCYELSTSHASLHGSHDMRENGGEDKVTLSSSPCTTPFDVSEDVNGDKEVASSMTAQQSTSGDSVDALGPYTEPERKDTDSLNLDVKLLETPDELASPLSKDRVLKYTFQRKRKRDSVVNDENSHLDEENPREKMTKKQNGNHDPVKSSEVTDSLRDGRGSTQVARQLVSMSEKKWIK